MVYVASVVSLALLAVGIRHRRSRSTMALALPWRDATVTDGALHPADVDVPPSPVGALPPGPALVLLAPRANAVGPYRPGATKVIATRAGTLDDLRADALRNEFATLLWVTVAGVPVLCVTDGVPTVCVGAVVALALTWRLRVRRRVGSVAAGA